MTFEQLKAIFQTDLTFDVIKCALSTIFDTLSVPDFLTKETTQGSYNLLLSMTYSSRFSFIFGIKFVIYLYYTRLCQRPSSF